MAEGIITQKLPSIPPLVHLALGLFLTLLVLFYLPFHPPLAIALMVLASTVFLFLWQRFFLLGIALGIIAISFNTTPPYRQSFTQCHYQADISQINYASGYRGREIRLEAKNIRCQAQVLPDQTLQFWDNQQQFPPLASHRMTVTSDLQPIHARLNPDTFDYERYLIASGIRLQVRQPTIHQQTDQPHPILRLRHALSEIIVDQLSTHNAAIILALVTGNRTALSAIQKQTLQETGSSHILAISGLHLALIGGLAWIFGQWIWALSWRLSDKVMPIQAGAVFAFFIISIYALLTGFEIPVKRAWIMFSLLIFSWLWLKSLSTHSLLISAIAVMFITPYSVVSVGFYFSFLATFIVLWCAQLNTSPLIKILIMQGLINLALMPITWFAFSYISLSSLLVNLLIIPWLDLWVLPWTMMAAILSFISPTLAQPLWSLVNFSTTALWQTIDFFNHLHWSINPSFTPHLVTITLAITCLVVALITRKISIAVGFLCLFIPITYRTEPALIVADERYTSALIHNGKTAIIINPGRHYRQINQAKKWQRYLQKHRLSLTAVILSDDKISHISATQWLLNRHPTAKVITLKPLFLPYPNSYCHPVSVEQLKLTAKKREKHCIATLQWFNRSIDLFATHRNFSLGKQSRLTWQGKTYRAQVLGAITVILSSTLDAKTPPFTLSSERQKQRLWRQ